MNISFVVGFSRPAVRAYSLNKYILMIARVLRDLNRKMLFHLPLEFSGNSNQNFWSNGKRPMSKL